jgi:hypothetical protein
MKGGWEKDGTNRWVGGWMDGWMDGWIDEWICQMNKWVVELVGVWVDWRMGGWIWHVDSVVGGSDGKMGGLVDG